MTASRWVAKAGTLRNVTPVTFPSRQSARTRIRPAGASSVSSVTGSVIGSRPVSSNAVTTHIVFVPLIPGYSTCSMITYPADASGFDDGRTRLQFDAGNPRGSRSIRRRRSSRFARSQVILSNIVEPGKSGTPSTMTRPGSPAAWRSTARMVGPRRIGGSTWLLVTRSG